jgi:hypothetical protein
MIVLKYLLEFSVSPCSPQPPAGGVELESVYRQPHPESHIRGCTDRARPWRLPAAWPRFGLIPLLAG